MNRKRRCLFAKLIQSHLDNAEDEIETVEGRELLARFQIALNGTQSHPDSVAVAGYTGLVEGWTKENEEGDFLYETVLEELGERLDQLAREFDGELLVFGEELPYDEKAEQFEV